MSVQRDLPYGRFNYLVHLSGEVAPEEPAGGFAEVSGLGIEVEYVEYRAGNDVVNAPRKLPGLHRVGDVTLRRGVVGVTNLFDWLRRVSEGRPEPRSVQIRLLDEARTPVVTWNLRNAAPKRWSGPTLVAGSSDEVAIEELVLVAEGISME